MKVLALSVSVFAGLIALGLLAFFYVVPDGGVMRGLLALSQDTTVQRDVILATALAGLNVATALLTIAWSGIRLNVGPVLLSSACLMLLVAIADAILGVGSSIDRAAWIPWLDVLSVLHSGVSIGAMRTMDRLGTRLAK